MKSYEINNYRMIKVSYTPPTNSRGGMVKIFETNRYNDQKTLYKKFSYDYEIGDIAEQTFRMLINNRFKIVGRASECGYYVFFCDNWGDEYIEVSDIE